MTYSKLIYISLALAATNTAHAQQCDMQKMSVNASQNVEFEMVFHNGFSDEIQVDRGPKTEVISKNYKVDALESAQRVQEQVTLPPEFDLSQDDTTTLKSLRFAMDGRGGTHPQDHTPSFVSIDRDNRVLTVSVDLENKKVSSDRVGWTFQIAQARLMSQTVEPYPTEIASRSVTRSLNAANGAFDTSPVPYNKMNTTRYVSVVHKASRCVVKSYELANGAYQPTDEINNPVELVAGSESAKVTIDLASRPSDTNALQMVLVPQLTTD